MIEPELRLLGEAERRLLYAPGQRAVDVHRARHLVERGIGPVIEVEWLPDARPDAREATDAAGE